MLFEYWFMFPVAFLVATIAMASGIGGATLFTPIFLIGLHLSPEVAIGTGLITEVFGFGSGVLAYARKRLIDFALGRQLLMATVPMALIGTWAAGQVNPTVLKVILGVGLFAVAASFLRTPDEEDIVLLDRAIQEKYGGPQAESLLRAADGEEFRYTVCNRREGRLIAGVGALFVGLISTGLGELNGYFLLQRCRVPSPVAVATGVFVVAVTALVAASGHLFQFARLGGETLDTVLRLTLFTVPGVILGGQAGSWVARQVPQHRLERALGVLFILVAGLTLGEVIF